MKMKSVVMLAVAMGCGLVAMLGVRKVLEGNQANAKDTVKVLVAVTELVPGEPLVEAKNVTFKEWPKDLTPPGAITKPEQFKDRAMKVQVSPGEALLLSKLGDPGVYSASSEIPDGMRVATVKVDPTMTHSGLMMPGDYVDVLVTYAMTNPKTRKPVKKIKTVLELVKVFANDNQRASAATSNAQAQSETTAKYVSLLVTPKQDIRLKLAKEFGDLHLTLRPKGDNTLTISDDLDEFMFDEEESIAGSDGNESSNTEGKAESSEGNQDSKQSQQITEFLEENEQEKPVEETAAPVVPEKQQWKIVIFKGEEKVEEFVDLPEEKTEVLVAPPETTTPVDSASTKNSWWSSAFQMMKQSRTTTEPELQAQQD